MLKQFTKEDVVKSNSIPTKIMNQKIIPLYVTKRFQFGWNVRILFGMNHYCTIKNIQLPVGIERRRRYTLYRKRRLRRLQKKNSD